MIQDYIRKATVDDALFLAERLREEDVKEIQAASGFEPLHALLLGLAGASDPWTLHYKGTPAAMMGANPGFTPGVGYIWLLATPLLVEKGRIFLKYCRQGCAIVHETYPFLWTLTDARNEVHLKWLQWMGFNKIKDHPNYGHEGRLFHEMVKVVDSV